MSTGKKYPCIPARIAAWVCAVLLTIVLACTLLGMTAARMLSSEESHVRISTDRQVIAGQMEKIAGAVSVTLNADGTIASASCTGSSTVTLQPE